MAQQNFARNDLSRAFIFDNGIFKCQTAARFANCVSVDALSQDVGDITKIECPSPTVYGAFEEVGVIRGENGRMTTTLTGRMNRDEISSFYQLAKRGCAFDLHLHWGLCQKPDAFNQFDMIQVFENVYVTNYGTDPLSIMQSGDRAVVQETVDISIGNYYQIINPKYTERASTLTTDGAIVTMLVADSPSCGSVCAVDSNGYNKLVALTVDGVSYYSNDAGLTWVRVVVDATPSIFLDLVAWKDLLVAIDDNGSIWTIDAADYFAGTATVWTETTTVFTPDALAADTIQAYGIAVGTGGNIWKWTDNNVTPSIVDAGVATTQNLLDVDATDEISVAVGNAGAVVYSFDGDLWFTATVPVAANLTAVVVKNKTNWLVGSVAGLLYCTENGGVSWSQVRFTGQGTVAVNDLQAATSHVLFMAHGTRLLRSVDGGSSWIVEPNSNFSFPTNTGVNSIGVSTGEPNFVVTGGVNAATAQIILGVA